MVRVEPFHYTGKVWCLKVPTGCFVAWRDGMAFPTGNSGFPKSLDISKQLDRMAGAKREVVGRNPNDRDANSAIDFNGKGNGFITAPATPEAQQWAGWGTALKPSWEPVILARKPLEGTVAANVLAHGTGGINVDGCRVGANDLDALQKNWDRVQSTSQGIASTGLKAIDLLDRAPAGRWPANLILTYPEDEYKLRDNITPQQLAKLAEWMNENA